MSEWNATCSQAPCNKPRTPEEQLMEYRDEQRDIAENIRTLQLSLPKITLDTPRSSVYLQIGPEEY